MVDARAIYLLPDFHAEETTVSRGVCQQFLLVAGADEGGDASLATSIRILKVLLVLLWYILLIVSGNYQSSVRGRH